VVVVPHHSMKGREHPMRTGRLAAAVVVAVWLASIVGLAQQRNAEIQRILLDATLWGRALPSLLVELSALRNSGETTAYVFADRAAGALATRARDAALARLQRGREAAARPAALQPPFATMQQQVTQRAVAPLRLEVAKIIDGDGYHVVLTGGAAVELLAPGLTISAVRARLGPPERVTQLTIHAEGESKPIFLTLYHYAGGAIAFAESDMAEADMVERVVLNLPAVVPAVVR
jgi:hypothetical protein